MIGDDKVIEIAAMNARLREIADRDGADAVYIVPTYPGLTDKLALQMRLLGPRPRGERATFLYVPDDRPPPGVDITWALDHRRFTNEYERCFRACRMASQNLVWRADR